MTHRHYSPAEAARRLGISAKALRLYEQRGLIAPLRTEAGWRAYGPDEMARAGEIAALRALGFSLAQVEEVLAGRTGGLEPALARHQERLEAGLRSLVSSLDQVRNLRGDLAAGRTPDLRRIAELVPPAAEPVAAIDLPWPWAGERFEAPLLRPVTWLVGPLGSGKTRLAQAMAEALPGGRFVPLDRTPPASVGPEVVAALDWLAEDGATSGATLSALMAGLCETAEGPIVVDLVEQGLDEPTQHALAAWLRARPPGPSLILMTRSSAMLDLPSAAIAGEAVLFCPANHAPPAWVDPRPGAPGYEAVASCLGTPDARARTEGLTAVLV